MAKRTVRTALLGLIVSVAAGATVLTVPVAPVSAAQRDLALGAGHAPTQAALDTAVAAGAPGAQGEAQQGLDTWFGSSAVADRRTTGRPLREGDRFRVGSVTKTFVATVLLQLAAEKRLSLDDTVEHWLPGVVRGNGNDGTKITVRQLLNHTSGIFNYTNDPTIRARMTGNGFLRHRYDTYPPEQLVRAALAHPPLFAPGRGWSYSNTNYILAGMIVRRITGHPYAEEIERRVIRPLGLRSTTLPGTSPTVPGQHGRAYSTLSDTGPGPGIPIHDVTEFNPSIAASAGEMISTASDLDRFYRALLRGELLPARQLQEMLTTVPTGENGWRYGLGISSLRLSCGATVWGHDGGIFGSLSEAAASRDGGHAVAVNLNADWVQGNPSPVDAEFCPAR
jgi:D-alanyl-D-alanine carboxypeptidase